METFSNLFPDELYHSYIIEGDIEILSLKLLEFLKSKEYIKDNNQDLLIRYYDAFTVDDSNKIKEWHNEMGITDGKRICIIGAKFINYDAERTLLKIIEEPAINTHFFLVVPNSLVLLDTIRSRAHIVKFPNAGLVEESAEVGPRRIRLGPTSGNKDNDFNKMAESFILMNQKNRIDFVANIIKKYKDKESSSNLRFVAIQFINEIEKIIFFKFKKDQKDKNFQFILGEIEKSRDFLNLPGAGVKMILENLALVI